MHLPDIPIEELLGRQAQTVNPELIGQQLNGKVILITGAAGSVGSELSRQILRCGPKKVILLDQAESALYELELELEKQFGQQNYEAVLGDICQKSDMDALFNKFKPQLVFHAAAYKHVPMMERHVALAVAVNSLATQLLAELALAHRTEKFIFISTDKAVRPTSIMGASKALAERYIQALNGEGVSRFLTVRFGNVIESSGSVIPVFRKQIRAGGPVQVTHSEASRYFISLQQAVRLVLEVAVEGQGGKIYFLEMGKAYNILELARQLIRLEVPINSQEIPVQITGLRPGEKLEEDLLQPGEKSEPAWHTNIRLVHPHIADLKVLRQALKHLEKLRRTGSDIDLVAKLREVVPEFRSNNPAFQKLKS